MTSRFFFFLSLALALTACKNDQTGAAQNIEEGGPNASMINNPLTANLPTDTNQLARIHFVETEFDFGEIKEGEVVVHRFQFSNTGQIPLTILKAYAGCGCTVPEWPEAPIAPGETSEIMVKFNSEGKKGQLSKIVKVIANTFPNETQIKIKVNVKAKT